MSVDDISIDVGNDHEALVDRAFIDAFETLAEYERRSLAHVAGLPEQLQAAGLWRGIGFRIGQRRLVSSYESVAEILTVPQITPVPGSHPWMLGVANVRSNLLPVVDLKQFLEGARSVLHEGHQKVMVLRQPGGDVAVTIDELYGQRSFMDEQQVEPEGLIDGRYASFIDRAYRVADDVWGVFSLDRLVRTPEFRHAAV
jgi:twitching motility protein PilI